MAGKMPTDIVEGKLAIEVHYYNPWQFWGMEKDESWGKVFYYWGEGNHYEGSTHNANWGEEDDMRKQLLMMKTNFIDQGYPVVIGEFGANWRDLSSLPNESQEHHNASIKSHYRFFHDLCKAMGSVVPMTWDVNYPNQEGSKGNMTVIDRNELSVFGVYALEGINEVYPRSSETSIAPIMISEKQSAGIYTLQGTRLTSAPTSPGIYIINRRKYVK